MGDNFINRAIKWTIGLEALLLAATITPKLDVNKAFFGSASRYMPASVSSILYNKKFKLPDFTSEAYAGVVNGQLQVTLSWDPNTESDLAGYEVWSKKAGGTYGLEAVVCIAGRNDGRACDAEGAVDVHKYTVLNLEPNKVYDFRVKAFDTEEPVNVSGFSNEVSYTTGSIDPSDVTAPQLAMLAYQVNGMNTTIQGSVIDDSHVDVYFYGDIVGDGNIVNQGNGVFNFEAALANYGNNDIWLKAIDSAGNETIVPLSINTDVDSPVTDHFDVNVNADGISLGSGFNDPNFDHAEVYVNNMLAQTFTDSEFAINQLPLHLLADGENTFSIRAYDNAGNETLEEKVVNLKLGYKVIETAEEYASSAEARSAWRYGNWASVGSDVELVEDTGNVTEGVKSLALPFSYIPVNRCTYWTKDMQLNLDDYVAFEFDMINPRNGGDVAPKLEARQDNGGYFSFSTGPMPNGDNSFSIDIDSMNPSNNPVGRMIDSMRVALFNRGSSEISSPQEGFDKVYLDNFLAINKTSIDGFETYLTDGDAQTAWKYGAWQSDGSPVILEPTVTEGNQSIGVGISYIPVNKCVHVTYDLPEPMDKNQIESFMFDIDNPADGSNLAYKLELRQNGGGYFYQSGPKLSKGTNKISVNTADMGISNAPEGTMFDKVRIAIFNRGSEDYAPETEVRLKIDNVHAKPVLIYQVPE